MYCKTFINYISNYHIKSVRDSFSLLSTSVSSRLGRFRSLVFIVDLLPVSSVSCYLGIRVMFRILYYAAPAILMFKINNKFIKINITLLSHYFFIIQGVLLTLLLLHMSSLQSRLVIRRLLSSTRARLVEESLKDKHGRSHNYLRVSLTERCNLRCIKYVVSFCKKIFDRSFLFYRSVLHARRGRGTNTIRRDTKVR